MDHEVEAGVLEWPIGRDYNIGLGGGRVYLKP